MQTNPGLQPQNRERRGESASSGSLAQRRGSHEPGKRESTAQRKTVRQRLNELVQQMSQNSEQLRQSVVEVKAIRDHKSDQFGILSFKEGDIIGVLEPFNEKWSFGVKGCEVISLFQVSCGFWICYSFSF